MTLDTSTQIAAGWYPDPQGSFQQRWWDGSAWTNEFAQYRPTLNYTPQTRAAAAGEAIPVYAPAAASPLSPPAPRADLLNAAPAVQVPIQTPAQPPPPPADLPTVPAAVTPPVTPPVEPFVAEQVAPFQPTAHPVARHAMPTQPDAPGAFDAVASPAAPLAEQSMPAFAQSPASATAESRAQPAPFGSESAAPVGRYTFAGWVLALLPVIAAGAAAAVATYVSSYYTLGTVAIAGGVLAVLLIVLGYADSSRLRQLGNDRTVPGIVAILGPIYFIARSFVVARTSGRPAIWLLVASLLVWGGAAMAYVVVPGLAALVSTLR